MSSSADKSALIELWVRPEIRAISAYHVADPSGMIKLDAMENPYTWPESLRQEWLQLLHTTDVNRYPDPVASPLKQVLRQAADIPEAAELLFGNGSDEIIQMLALALGGPDRVMLSVEPGFVMYRMIAAFTGMRYESVALNPQDYSLDEAALLAAIEQHRPALVFLAYPNNPTGNLFDADALLRIIQATPGVVVIDEAYAPFTDASFMDRVLDYPNLLVMRTLSKMGLAGLRLGYIVGDPLWITELDKTRMPYNINVLTQLSARFALENKPVFDQQSEEIRRQREQLFEALKALPGLQPMPSEANFILCRVPQGAALQLFEGLKTKGVLIKNLHGGHPLLSDCLRFTVGKAEENAALLKALEDLL